VTEAPEAEAADVDTSVVTEPASPEDGGDDADGTFSTFETMYNKFEGSFGGLDSMCAPSNSMKSSSGAVDDENAATLSGLMPIAIAGAATRSIASISEMVDSVQAGFDSVKNPFATAAAPDAAADVAPSDDAAPAATPSEDATPVAAPSEDAAPVAAPSDDAAPAAAPSEDTAPVAETDADAETEAPSPVKVEEDNLDDAAEVAKVSDENASPDATGAAVETEKSATSAKKSKSSVLSRFTRFKSDADPIVAPSEDAAPVADTEAPSPVKVEEDELDKDTSDAPATDAAPSEDAAPVADAEDPSPVKVEENKPAADGDGAGADETEKSAAPAKKSKNSRLSLFKRGSKQSSASSKSVKRSRARSKSVERCAKSLKKGAFSRFSPKKPKKAVAIAQESEAVNSLSLDQHQSAWLSGLQPIASEEVQVVNAEKAAILCSITAEMSPEASAEETAPTADVKEPNAADEEEPAAEKPEAEQASEPAMVVQ